MNKYRKNKISIAVFAIFGVMASSAFAQQNSIKVDFNGNSNAQKMGGEIVNVSADDPLPEEKKDAENKGSDTVEKESSEKENGTVSTKDGVKLNLNPHESQVVDAKKHALSKALYENEQLEELRGMLEGYQKKEAYESAVDSKVPLTPEQIIELRTLLRNAEKAKNVPLQGSVSNKIRSIDIDVDANEPIKLDVVAGYASSIVFFDITGAPWPIDGDIIGNKTAFDTKPGNKSHVAVFENIQQFSESNALINLLGLDVPVVISLVGNDQKVDSRLSVRIPKFGPNAQNEIYQSDEMKEVSADALKVLDGDKLPNSKRFKLNGVKGEVIYANGSLYIRTRANLISPPWRNSVSSSSGYKVYELPPVDTLLFSVDGKMVDATIEKGFEVKIEQQKSIFSE